jgi:23S rRNA maturation mini-RNase III
MQSGLARRRNVSLIADMATAIMLMGSVTFFILVVEYHVGHGELTAAQLHLLAAKTRLAHAQADNNQNWKPKETSHEHWWSNRATN